MIAKEGIPYLAILLTLTVSLYYLYPVLALIPLALLIFVLFFFRNPPRQIQEHPQHILSPADGKIMEIEELNDQTYFNGRAVKISIFLSLFNVHINRSPVSGRIIHTEYKPGKYLPAYKKHASEMNERNTIVIENKYVKVFVHQIAGLIARRIVSYNKKGDFLNQGQIFGMIKFGSCTEIILPDRVKVLARKGQKVKAGITVLGVLGDE